MGFTQFLFHTLNIKLAHGTGLRNCNNWAYPVLPCSARIQQLGISLHKKPEDGKRYLELPNVVCGKLLVWDLDLLQWLKKWKIEPWNIFTPFWRYALFAFIHIGKTDNLGFRISSIYKNYPRLFFVKVIFCTEFYNPSDLREAFQWCLLWPKTSFDLIDDPIYVQKLKGILYNKLRAVPLAPEMIFIYISPEEFKGTSEIITCEGGTFANDHTF